MTERETEDRATLHFYEGECARLRKNMVEITKFNKGIVAENEQLIGDVKRYRNMSILKEQAIFEDGRRCGFAYGAGVILLAVAIVLAVFAV